MFNPVPHRADGRGRRLCLGLLALLTAFAAAASAARDDNGAYVQRNLISEGSIPAERTDPGLISPWGIAASPTGMLWIAGNGMGFSAGYDSQGNPLAQGVEIPGGNPTGIVSNDGADFPLPCPGGTSAPSAFIFASETGIISAWNAKADPANAVAVVDNSQGGAVYKGLAIAGDGNGRFLYATDFHGAKVDVFDGNFKPVRLPAGAFRDPNLPGGFAPFGIQNINGSLYISYAKQDDLKEDGVPGAGQGFVNVFEPGGRLVRRLISRGNLNAPWGMALAPADFGQFGNHLLVANFGDGRINAYNPATGEFKGSIHSPENRPIAIDGLWGICFAKRSDNGPASALFFTAGPAYENKGLYGRIERAGSVLMGGPQVRQPSPAPDTVGKTQAPPGDPQGIEASEAGAAAERLKAQAASKIQGQQERDSPAGQEEDDTFRIHASNLQL